MTAAIIVKEVITTLAILDAVLLVQPALVRLVESSAAQGLGALVVISVLKPWRKRTAA